MVDCKWCQKKMEKLCIVCGLGECCCLCDEPVWEELAGKD